MTNTIPVDQQTAERRLLLWHTNFLTAAIVAAFAAAMPARVLVVLVVWLVAAAVLAALLLWARRQCRPVRPATGDVVATERTP